MALTPDDIPGSRIVVCMARFAGEGLPRENRENIMEPKEVKRHVRKSVQLPGRRNYRGWTVSLYRWMGFGLCVAMLVSGISPPASAAAAADPLEFGQVFPLKASKIDQNNPENNVAVYSKAYFVPSEAKEDEGDPVPAHELQKALRVRLREGPAFVAWEYGGWGFYTPFVGDLGEDTDSAQVAIQWKDAAGKAIPHATWKDVAGVVRPRDTNAKAVRPAGAEWTARKGGEYEKPGKRQTYQDFMIPDEATTVLVMLVYTDIMASSHKAAVQMKVPDDGHREMDDLPDLLGCWLGAKGANGKWTFAKFANGWPLVQREGQWTTPAGENRQLFPRHDPTVIGYIAILTAMLENCTGFTLVPRDRSFLNTGYDVGEKK